MKEGFRGEGRGCGRLNCEWNKGRRSVGTRGLRWRQGVLWWGWRRWLFERLCGWRFRGRLEGGIGLRTLRGDIF